MTELEELDNLIDISEELVNEDTDRLTFAIIDKESPIDNFYAFGTNEDTAWDNLKYYEYDIPDKEDLICVELPGVVANDLNEVLKLSALDINDESINDLLIEYRAETATSIEEKWVCRIFNADGKLIHKEIAMVYPKYDHEAEIGEQISYADAAVEQLIDESNILSNKLKSYLRNHLSLDEYGIYNFETPADGYGYIEPVKEGY